MSNNQVNAIYKDGQGFLWFGTMSGLTRYDGYTCKIFRHIDADSTSLPDDDVQQIFGGPDGKMWVRMRGNVCVYDGLRRKFSPRPGRGLVAMLGAGFGVYADSGVYQMGRRVVRAGSDRIVAASLDSKGYIWLVHADGLLVRVDTIHGRVVDSTAVLRDMKNGATYSLYIDRQDVLWLYAKGSVSGLYAYKPGDTRWRWRHFTKSSEGMRLSADAVNDVVQDDKGTIWIATDQGGVDLLDKEKLTVRYLWSSEEAGSLVQNSILSLYKDDAGIVWLGSFKKGVCYFPAGEGRFPLVAQRRGGLPYDDVSCFAEDAAGDVWIGTNGGGLIRWDRRRHVFDRVRAEGRVVGLAVDRGGRVWVGNYRGGLDRFDGRRWRHFGHDGGDSSSLADDRVNCLSADAEGRVWIGTMGGLDRFDPGKEGFYHYGSSAANSISFAGGDVWIGTANGIEVLSTGKIRHLTHDNSGLSDNAVNDVLEDGYGDVWVATRRGLNVLMPGKDTFRVFMTGNGLPDNTILNMLNDEDGNLWVSTSSGLSKIVVTRKAGDIAVSFSNYDVYDGLQGQLFNEHAVLKTRGGELIFGGANGFNIFDPADVGTEVKPAPVVITGFWVSGREVHLADTAGVGLSRSENSFSVGFAALDYIRAGKVRYAYRLEGLDTGWVMTDGKNRRADYVNLTPGKYVFRVRAGGNEAVLKIDIRPCSSDWRGYAIGSLVLAVLAGGGWLLVRRRVAGAGRPTQRVYKSDSMKIKFPAQVSLGLRSRLSLILELFNLLSNAYVFTSEGGKASVGLRIAEKSDDRIVVEMTVRDEGDGGNEAGLAAVREFVKQHGGSIMVNSKGCTILLPFKIDNLLHPGLQ